MLYPPEWSPDGAHLAFSDKDSNLWALTVADRTLVRVARESHDPQLECGVAEVMKAIAATPVQLPPRPPDPVKKTK